MTNLNLYSDLSSWWPLLSRPEDYAEEAEIYTRVIKAALAGANKAGGPGTAGGAGNSGDHAAGGRKPTLLELGSGGGNNASHMKHDFDLTLVDRSPGMLAVSQKLNPELPHLEGDMRSVRLGRTFDAVFIHDAIVYMTTLDNLRQAIQTAWVHTRPGGAALLAPDMVKETFRPSTEHGGHDGTDGFPAEYAKRSLRYLAWTYDPDPQDTTYLSDFAFLLKEGGQAVRVAYDRHIQGIFPRDTWLELMRQAGFRPQVLPFEHSEVEPGMTEMFLGIRAMA